LLRDISIALAYLKQRSQTVSEVHRNLLRVSALNKYIVHLPHLKPMSLGGLLRYDCYKELSSEKDYLPLA